MLEGRYRIEDVVEEGGFGIVYLGWDEILRTKISVKEYFPRELAGRVAETNELTVYRGEAEEIFEKGLEKFLDEARVMAAFQHLEGIVWVRDFFYANCTAYIIMEYVEGQNVKECVEKNGKMNVKTVFSIMQPILQSLEQIHQKGLIHRDVSPENIIINSEGKAYLIDFGITRPYTGEDFKTITVFFKRGYAAEEQYREKGKQGPWTDIYGACATMYYMLTGVTPEESAQRNIKDTLVPLSAYRDLELPENVKKAIKKGMAVEASKRYTTVTQLYRELYEDEGYQMRRRRKKICMISGSILGGILIITMALAGWKSFAEKEVASGGDRSINSIKNDTKDELAGVTPTPTPEVTVTPVPEKIYTIPNVKGKVEEKAKKLIKKSNNSLKITIKRVYHDSVKKGKVIRQSVRASREYKKGEIKKIVLTISKGKKPVPVSTPVVTQPPVVQTPVPQTPKPKKQNNDDYAGILPY